MTAGAHSSVACKQQSPAQFSLKRGWFLIAISVFILTGCGGALAPLPTYTPTITPTETLTVAPGATPTRANEMNLDPKLAALVEQARADLATRLNAPADSFTLKSAEAVEWRDAGLGCPRPGVMYAQVITPGYRIIFDANGEEYDYRSDGRRIVLCEQ